MEKKVYSSSTIDEKILFCRQFLKSRSKKRQIRKWKPTLTEKEQWLFDNEQLLSADLNTIANACGQHKLSHNIESFVPIHHFCRKGMYPKTSIQRQQMSDEQVPWNINFPDYNPPYYTDPSLLHSKSDIDPEEFSSKFMWNTFDTNFHVDRRTANPTANYKIDQQGYPLNPLGRTGLRGRGELKRWSVNYLTHLVIMCGTNQIQSGKEIFKFIMKKNEQNSFYEIPSTWTTGANMNAISLTLKMFLSNIYRTWNNIEDNQERKIDEIIKHLTFVSTAYIDDEKNTDNAWLETSVCCYIQTNLNRNLDLNELFPIQSFSNYTWHQANHSSSLLDSERDVLRLIANHYNAYW